MCNNIFVPEDVMRKDIYIFRHGETDYNKEKRWQGCGIDTDLNEVGRRQAVELAKKLSNLQLEIIYSSPLKRALQTAEVVAKNWHISIEVIAGLREGSFGKTEGMLKSEVAIKYPDIYNAWYSPTNDMNICFPEGETKQQMQDRMLKVLHDIEDKPYSQIGISSHGSSIRYLLMYFGLKPKKMLNTALFHLVYDGNAWSLVEEIS